MNPSFRRLIRSLSNLAMEVAKRLEQELTGGHSELEAARISFQEALCRDVPAAECADMLSQAMVCSLPLVIWRREAFEVAGPWLLEGATAWQRIVLKDIYSLAGFQQFKRCNRWLIAADVRELLSTEYSVVSTEQPTISHLFEHFLHHHHRLHRKRGGVFYTPPELVQFITRSVHQQLRNEFGLPGGLAEASILDPAAGTGAFLLGAIDVIRSSANAAVDWNQYVSQQLLPRLQGIEIIPAACLAAQLNIAIKLADTGFDFRLAGKIRVELGNTLCEKSNSRFEISDLRRQKNALPVLKSQISNLKSPLVLLGNPPFSSLSDNRGKWITNLVHGSQENSGYIVAADERLQEKKTWLHDDYVKFIRYAQWRIEQAGGGIVGFVTSHGYLDNITFRLMRRELLRVFQRIDVVDLHGNRKKGEQAPVGPPDENIFGLDQGIAVLFARRLPEQDPPASALVRHAELWGTREDKLRRLADAARSLVATTIHPSPPSYLFAPAPLPAPPEYAAAWRLPDAMPVNTTAPVTARDHFVISTSRQELCRRIEEFRDLSIPDDEIRSRYFTRTRSAKYPPGDTRSWKLSVARRIIAAEQNWQSFVRRCLYRPFDWRYVFWHKGMIDWPRSAFVDRAIRWNQGHRGQETGDMSPVSCPPSPVSCLLLLSRRQMLPTQPCSFFWMSDTLPIDGVIRSDNRGSESIFPLYLYEPVGQKAVRRGNFSAPFVDAAAMQLQLAWLPDDRGNLRTTFGPEDLFFYIYALFHSPTYRERYAAELRTDFPRVLFPRSCALFADLVPRGERLTAWHTLRTPPPIMNGVAADQLQQFRAGGHQPLRPSRRTTAGPLAHPLAPYIAATLHEMSAIDGAIEKADGWPKAFSG